MQRVINTAIISNKELILLRKQVNEKSSWILPGGKPRERESDILCINRELSEELPLLKLDGIFLYINSFEGISPNQKSPLRVEVYRHQGTTNRDLTPSSNPEEPIKEARFFDYDSLCGIALSETTRKIVSYLKRYFYI